MSTRSTTWFTDGGDPADTVHAKVYRHTDGYPEGHGRDLQRFLADVEEQTRDTRFNDPSYLAAKLVVWLGRGFARDYDTDANGDFVRTSHADSRPLDFISVGVVLEDPFDVEFVYVVDCAILGEDGRPRVTCHERGGTWDEPVTLGSVVEIPALEPEEVV